MHPVLIVGPTGIGKTALSVELALRIDAEIISADSVQIYRIIDKGTGKPKPEELKGVPIHLIDYVAPNAYYSAYNFVLDTKVVINENKGPFIISGGTGLFIEGLIRGIAPSLPRDEKLRNEIRQKAEESSWREMHSMVEDVDPEYAAKISSNDPVRITRALEIYFLTGKTLTSLKEVSAKNKVFNDYTLINLVCPREVLYQKIEKRIDNWLADGWVGEVKKLYENKTIDENVRALGFSEIVAFLKGEIKTRSELAETIKKKERNYAKRQITWFKRYEERIDMDLTFDLESDTIKLLELTGVENGN